MDMADAAYMTQQLEFGQFLRRAKIEFRVGPRVCSRCGEYNDRSSEGYCICSECMTDPASPSCSCKE